MGTKQLLGGSRIERGRSLVADLLAPVRGSFIYFIWTLGLLMLLAAVVIQEGVIAALLAIFGVSAFIYGILGYLGLKLIGYS